jgi:hypothetical protein
MPLHDQAEQAVDIRVPAWIGARLVDMFGIQIQSMPCGIRPSALTRPDPPFAQQIDPAS